MHLPTGLTMQLLQDAQDAGAAAAPYDTIWTVSGPVRASGTFEQVMLSNDKLFVVLGVVLIIWIGLVVLLLRTDRRLASLERTVEENIPDVDPLGPDSPTESTAERTSP